MELFFKAANNRPIRVKVKQNGSYIIISCIYWIARLMSQKKLFDQIVFKIWLIILEGRNLYHIVKEMIKAICKMNHPKLEQENIYSLSTYNTGIIYKRNESKSLIN